MLTMPTVRQSPTANYTPVPIRHDLVILHMMEGSYAGSISWLCRPSVQASAHLCLKADGSEVTQLVPLSMKAWAQCRFNGAGVSLEIEGFTARGLSDVTLEAAARIVAWLCHAYAIPPVWAQGGQGRGVCSHHDLGVGGGGHVDICGVGDATWQRMMAAIRSAWTALDPKALPPFALHGLPSPSEVVAVPFVPAEPSHGGAARHEPGDIINHPTLSGYAAHSISALQADLNTLGAFPPLAVDGGFGPRTEMALRQFQIVHGLVQDGMIGPASWAAIEGALMAKAA